MNHSLRAARTALARARQRFTGGPGVHRYVPLGQGTANTTTPLPPGAVQELVRGNPRLVELRRRYAALDSPLVRHTLWNKTYRSVELDLPYFRGDNAYVWQHRRLGDLESTLFLYLTYVEAFDDRELLGALGEDGAFGCWSFLYDGHARVSRDLLDSVNELYFLDRTWGLFDRSGFSVLDVGAGYGRLAHRMVAGVPGLRRYYCVDAVPESTFLCEYYLRYRGVDDKAEAVPLDELERVPAGGVDLAVNIHSFSEMSVAAIDEWLRHLERLGVPSLLVVPNDPDTPRSTEADGTRLPIADRIERAGYALVAEEPILREAGLAERLGVGDQFFFYQRAAGG